MTTLCGWCLPGDHRKADDPDGPSLSPWCSCEKRGCACRDKPDWPGPGKASSPAGNVLTRPRKGRRA